MLANIGRLLSEWPYRPFPVQMVTIPRSGHHLLVRMLKAVKPELRYCEFYRDRIDGCCGKSPCRGGIDLAKSHDLQLIDPIRRNRKYLIQVRQVLPTVVSHFELAVAAGEAEDTVQGFSAFARNAITLHRVPFARKWLSAGPENAMVVHYDDLTATPGKTVGRVAAWLWGDVEIPALEPIAAPRNITAFRHYDAGLFSELAAMAEDADRIIARHGQNSGLRCR